MAATALGPYSPASIATSLASGAAAIWSSFLLQRAGPLTPRQHGAHQHGASASSTREAREVDLIGQMHPLDTVLNYGEPFFTTDIYI